MKMRSWIRNLINRPVTRAARKARRGFRPTLEALEDRWCPATFVVNNPTDIPVSGETDLRQAITSANSTSGANAITFDSTVFATPQLIALGGTELTLSNTSGTQTITGPAAGVTVSGNNASRVFQVDSSVTASISGLTVTGGSALGTFGGGIYNLGSLTLTACTFNGNISEYGGGLFNLGGIVKLTNCTLAGNTATQQGGGVYNDAMSGHAGTATLTNCTLANNTATPSTTSQAGGIYSNTSTTMLTNCTLTGNTANNNGGGIFNYVSTMTVNNTIVAGNSVAGTENDIRNQSSTANGNYDLTGDNSAPGANSVSGAALLAPLGNYGGLTQTTAPLPGSPAIDAGSNALIPNGVTTDQRGDPRIVNGAVDIGAFEVNPTNDWYFWDPGHTASGMGSGGIGAWDTSTPNWFNGTSDVAWTNNTGGEPVAIFAGSAGTVTLGTAITASGLSFTTTGDTVTGNTLTLGGGINVASGAAATIASVIAGNSGLTVSGAGVLTLSGTNTYSGTTTVSAGTLEVSGSLAAGSAITVQNTATLDGTGTVHGTITAQSGATVSPGAPVGVLTTGSVTLNATSTVEVTLDSAAAGNFSQLNYTGNVNLAGANLQVNVGSNVHVGDSFVIVNTTTMGTLTGTFGNAATMIAAANNPLYSFSVSYANNDVTLTVKPFPPPSITTVVIDQDISALYNAAGQPSPGVQRSMVDDVVYTFSEPVNIPSSTANPNVFAINYAPGFPAAQQLGLPTLSWPAVSDGTTVSVSFTGANTQGNSVLNGEYQITVNMPAAITAQLDNQALALTASGIGSANQQFYRLFGDINGDEIVNAADSLKFKSALTTYNAAFDFNADGAVNAADNLKFKADLIVSFAGFVPTI